MAHKRGSRCSRWRPAPAARWVVVSVLLMTTALACGARANQGPAGSGRTVTETRQVPGFSAVELRGVGQLVVAHGDRETLSVEADDNLLPEITTTVADQTLVLELQRGRPSRPIVYRLTAPAISSLTTSGAGDIDATDLSAPRLQTSQSGAGSIRLARVKAQTLESSLAGSGALEASGSADSLRANVNGAGKLNLRDLATRDANLDISGAGAATVRVSESLRARISGAGSIEYLGNPRVEQEISGSGTVRRIDG